MRKALDVLGAGQAPDSDIVLYGPRGNGKTALLLWARTEARSRGIDVMRLSGAVVPSLESLAHRISARPSWPHWLGGFSLPWLGSVTLRNRPRRQVRAILAGRAGKRPTLLAVDEAHRLDTEVGAVLLNEVQELQGDDLPVMLILAGTPELPSHLRTMGSSFWDRGVELPIGRLRPQSAAEAIRVPLEEHGRAIDDPSLASVVHESQGYPFFLQVWGDWLWEGCQAPSGAVSLADVDRARPHVDRRRRLYYRHRYQELVQADLLPAAVGLAAVFARSDRASPEDVYPAIQTSLERAGLASHYEAVIDAARRLRDLGYVWQPGDDEADYFEPGIPSLMRHVERKPDLKIRR